MSTGGLGVSCVLGFRFVMCTGVLVCQVYWGYIPVYVSI